MKIFAGYDCGGTKTTCILADEYGRVLGKGTGGPSNFLSCGFSIASASIKESTKQALSCAGIKDEKLYSAYFGSAAVEFFSESQKVRAFFEECVSAKYIRFNNDAYIAFYGATFGKPGIIMVSGTGAVAYGIREDNSWVKVDGWGHLIGDEGSGYSIGNKAIRLAVKSFDGIAENKPFENAVLEHFSISTMRELIKIIYADPSLSRVRIASAAKCVFALYSEGNLIAAEILEDAANAIVASIVAVYKAMNVTDDETVVVFSGSVLKKCECISKLVKRKLTEGGLHNFRITWPEVSPVTAALLLSYNVLDGNNYNNSVERIICKCRMTPDEER